MNPTEAKERLDALEKKYEEKVRGLQEEAKTLMAANKDLAKVADGYKERLDGYKGFEEALGKIMGLNRLGGVGSNPTRSGETTLTDYQQVVTVKVKEIPVEVDTSTNRGKILRLASKGFFQDWRKAGEVSVELEKKGQAMNDKVVMMELANLCNLGYLGRTKRENQYVYKVPAEGVVFKDG